MDTLSFFLFSIMSTIDQEHGQNDTAQLAHGLVGQEVRFNGLAIPGVPENGMRAVVLTTRDTFRDLLAQNKRQTGDVSPAIASEVEYYHDNTGDWEKWYEAAGSRDALSGYAVPVGMGNVAAGMVLQRAGREIALIRRVLAIAPSGAVEDMPFTRLLVQAGLDRAQLKGIKVAGKKKLDLPPFVRAINNGDIIVVDRNAPFQLSIGAPSPHSSGDPRKPNQNADLHTTFVLKPDGIEQAERFLGGR